MTVAELIAHLQDYDENTTVCIAEPGGIDDDKYYYAIHPEIDEGFLPSNAICLIPAEMVSG